MVGVVFVVCFFSAVVSARGLTGFDKYHSITGSRRMQDSIVQSDGPFLFPTIFSSPVIMWQSGRFHRVCTVRG